MSCSICCESVNKSTRKEVKCMYCSFSACRTCCQTFVLSETTAKCMNSECGKEWTAEFIRESFPVTFITGPLKKHREDVLFDRERALLPATQPYAEARIRIKTYKEEWDANREKIRKLMTRNATLTIKMDRLRGNPLGNERVGEAVADTEERHKFIKPCPVDDCRGFLSTQWKCGLCSIWTCPDCHMVIGDKKDSPHTCHPDNVASAAAIKAETRPCPKCAVPIFKIDGCDQIWCTGCHTAFSFRTGKIETKIHNPHYYEWMRQNHGDVPRDVMDGACGEFQFDHHTARAITVAMNDITQNPKKLNRADVDHNVRTLVRNTLHIQEVYIRDDFYEQKNSELRIKYLMKEFDDEKFKTLLQQSEKKHKKTSEMQEVYRLVATASSDIIRRFLRDLQVTRILSIKILDEIPPLIEYANGLLRGIARTYNTPKVLVFNQILQLTDDK